MTAQQMYKNLVDEYRVIEEAKRLYGDLRSNDPERSGNARVTLEQLINNITPGVVNAQTSDSFIATKISELKLSAIMNGSIAMRVGGDGVIDVASLDKPEKFKDNYLRAPPVKTGNKNYDENVLPHHNVYFGLHNALEEFGKDSGDPQALARFIAETYRYVESDALIRVAGSFGKNRVFLNAANADDKRDLDKLSNIDALFVRDALSVFQRMSPNEAIAYVAGLAHTAKRRADDNIPEAERADYATALLKHALAETATLYASDPANGEAVYASLGRSLYDIVR